MPELAEVERCRKMLEMHCKGKRIVQVDPADDHLVYSEIEPTEFAKALIGRTIVDAKRHGKYLWLVMDVGPFPIFHLGMSGNFVFQNLPTMVYFNVVKKEDMSHDKKIATYPVEHHDIWPPKFTKCLFRLDDGLEISFVNIRRMGRIKLLEEPCKKPPLCDLGYDAHLQLPSLPDFSVAVLRRSLPIKALLLDQSFLAGIGNWIADEVLYQSRIHPSQPTNTLTANELQTLHSSITMVIDKALEVDADCHQFPATWIFHSRWGKGKGPIKTNQGQKIEFVTVGGRTSAIVPALQKLRKTCTTHLAPQKKKQRVTKKENNTCNEVAVSNQTSQSTKGTLVIKGEPVMVGPIVEVKGAVNRRKRMQIEIEEREGEGEGLYKRKILKKERDVVKSTNNKSRTGRAKAKETEKEKEKNHVIVSKYFQGESTVDIDKASISIDTNNFKRGVGTWNLSCSLSMLHSTFSRLVTTHATRIGACHAATRCIIPRLASTSTAPPTAGKILKRGYAKWTAGIFTAWLAVVAADLSINDDWDNFTNKLRPRLSEEARKDRPHVVILGTGWGALSAIRKLGADKYNVTIVSPRNYFLFTPLLPCTTTGGIENRCIIEPIRDYCIRADAEKAKFYEAECIDIDPKTNTVMCVNNIEGVPAGKPFAIKYDHLIMSVGTEPATFGIPGVQEHALFMKEASDGRKLRQRIMDVLEKVNCPDMVDEAEIERLLHFVVVGGGPTGVECAAELHDFVAEEVTRFFPTLKDKVKITLVEALPNVLSMFSRSLVEYAETKFSRERVELLTKSLVVGVDDNDVSIKRLETQEVIKVPYGTLLWASGIATRPVVSQLIAKIGAENGQTNRRALIVDNKLHVLGTDNIWAVGDCAYTGLAPTAQVAGQEGKYLGRLLRRNADLLYADKKEGNNKNLQNILESQPDFEYNHMGIFAYVGDSSAIADFSK
eukprot:Ihof_evm7s257 gene=Ihof_evmTU7s257